MGFVRGSRTTQNTAGCVSRHVSRDSSELIVGGGGRLCTLSACVVEELHVLVSVCNNVGTTSEITGTQTEGRHFSGGFCQQMTMYSPLD